MQFKNKKLLNTFAFITFSLLFCSNTAQATPIIDLNSDVNQSFTGNSSNTTKYILPDVGSNGSYIAGGAIFNSSDKAFNITGNFINNYIDTIPQAGGTSNSAYFAGGAISNYEGVLGIITGDFTNNYILTQTTTHGVMGAAISNHCSTIKSIVGNFENNYIEASNNSFNKNSGGAIANIDGIINNIAGNFTNNYINASGNGMIFSFGGAIYNDDNSIINTITSDFIDNYMSSTFISIGSAYSMGGAIYNKGVIDNVSGNFINNSIEVLGDSVGEYILYGGALYNEGVIESVSGNFINNYLNFDALVDPGYVFVYGGAIYNYGTINFLADNTSNSFTDNYILFNGVKDYNAIHNEDTLTFTMQGNGSFVMNDSITGNGGKIYIKGENANNNIFYLNDSITDNEVNVSNATLKLSSYTHNDNTITNAWVDTNASMNFTDNSILFLDLFGYDYTGVSPYGILSNSTISLTDSTIQVRNADMGTYQLGQSSLNLTDIISSASSLHTITDINNNEFKIVFDTNSSFIQNSQLGNFMTEIENEFTAQSDNSAIRFIFQASQFGSDTQKQSSIIDGAAQLNAVAGNSAHTRSAIQAKQNTIGARILQLNTTDTADLSIMTIVKDDVVTQYKNVVQLASNGNIEGLITESKKKAYSLWIMPSYTYEIVNDMETGSFSNGYKSQLFGLSLGIDKTFNPEFHKYYKLGFAVDGGMGFSNTSQDIEYIKNNFNYYGATLYGALYNRNWILSSNLGYQMNDSEVRQLLDNYGISENQAADVVSEAFYASLKAEYLFELENFFYFGPLYNKPSKKKIDEISIELKEVTDYANLAHDELQAELEKTLLKLENELKKEVVKYEEAIEEERKYKYIQLTLVPYIGLDITSVNSGDYNVYSYDNSGNTDATFHIETNRQNTFTIPLGLQIKHQLELANNWKITPQVSIGAAYTFGDLLEKSTTTATNLNSIANLETEVLDAFRGDLGLKTNIALSSVNIDLGYDLQVSKNRYAHSIFAKAAYEF